MENKDEMRKGPWTEQEDDQLVLSVKLFGDRRWDFIAKVSGLKRTGKSCRLRWVNYLHPGLTRGKLTPHEQRLVLELHSKLGNRWSKIAEKIPGRTDNEIKNYWRTHMRKNAQERKKAIALSQSSSSSNVSYSSTYNSPSVEINPAVDTTDRSFYDTGEVDMLVADLGEKETGLEIEKSTKVYSLDEIWKEVELSEKNCNLTCQSMDSPIWDFCPNNSLWCMDEEENKILMKSMSGYPFRSFSSFNHKFI